MNTQELVAAVAAEHGLTKTKAEAILNSIVSTISSEIWSGREVVVRNLGRFRTKERAARVCRNPQNGQVINVPAKQVAKFTPRGSFKG